MKTFTYTWALTWAWICAVVIIPILIKLGSVGNRYCENCNTKYTHTNTYCYKCNAFTNEKTAGTDSGKS